MKVVTGLKIIQKIKCVCYVLRGTFSKVSTKTESNNLFLANGMCTAAFVFSPLLCRSLIRSTKYVPSCNDENSLDMNCASLTLQGLGGCVQLL